MGDNLINGGSDNEPEDYYMDKGLFLCASLILDLTIVSFCPFLLQVVLVAIIALEFYKNRLYFSFEVHIPKVILLACLTCGVLFIMSYQTNLAFDSYIGELNRITHTPIYLGVFLLFIINLTIIAFMISAFLRVLSDKFFKGMEVLFLIFISMLAGLIVMVLMNSIRANNIIYQVSSFVYDLGLEFNSIFMNTIGKLF